MDEPIEARKPPLDTTSMDDLGEAPSGGSVAGHQVEPAKKTFFYEKPDGEIFACGNDEAALFGRNYRLVGVSNGMKYRDHIRQHVKKGKVYSPEEARKILLDAFDLELAEARGHLERPQMNNVSFDASFPPEQRSSFTPPR